MSVLFKDFLRRLRDNQGWPTDMRWKIDYQGRFMQPAEWMDDSDRFRALTIRLSDHIAEGARVWHPMERYPDYVQENFVSRFRDGRFFRERNRHQGHHFAEERTTKVDAGSGREDTPMWDGVLINAELPAIVEPPTPPSPGLELTPDGVADLLSTVQGVRGVEVHSLKVHFRVPKLNGGRQWNNGRAYTTLYIDLATGELVADGVAGAATRKRAEEIFEEIEELLGPHRLS